MSKFLKQVVDYVLQHHSGAYESLQLVFPNRRAGLFFQKYMNEAIDRPLFSPTIITINELVTEISALTPADPNQLIVEMFRVFQQHTGTQETLDDFYYWGEMLLADFNDIDKYMVDTRQLFANIQSLKEIDAGFSYLTREQLEFLATFWENILTAKTSDDKGQFLGIWKQLIPIYDNFQQVLAKKNLAYEGMVYRTMVARLDDFIAANTNQYAFIGFNALNTCEKKLFTALQASEQGLFFWDYDDYYKNASHHEAALFVNENLLQFPMPRNFIPDTNNFSALEKIDVVAVPGFSGQATFAASWIENNRDKVSAHFDNTAVVLCDESLLTPMLNVLPSGVDELNITMGFPVKNLPAYAMVKALADLDKTIRKTGDNQKGFYYKHVLSLLSNPLLKRSLGVWFDQFVDRVRRENRIYIHLSEMKGNELLEQIFALPADAPSVKNYLQGILKYLFDRSPEEDTILKESLYQMHMAISRLHDSVFSDSEMKDSLYSKQLYYQLLMRQLDRLNIPFEGEPLAGMQLMGFLETRNLDFDNVILLSFNDDKLPGKSHQHSFVPYSLRKGFGLPVLEQRNAMYAFYFYRLIQRAKNVVLVYDSRSDGMSAGEISRYFTQLKYEASHLELNEKQAVFDFVPAGENEIGVEKKGAVYEELKKYLTGALVSPSALNTYIDCSLRFYFKYIEKIKETDEVTEDIDHLLFGRIAHVALEELYREFIGKEISVSAIRELMKDQKKLDLSLAKALKEEYFKKSEFKLNGKNLLVYDIIKKYVLQVLKYDSTIAPFTLLSLEEKYTKEINVETSNGNERIAFGGMVDRLDEVGGRIRVVDYKTGVSENKVAGIDKLIWAKTNRNKAAFQTMVYAGCVQESLKNSKPVMPAVYGARAVFKEDFDPLFHYRGDKLIYQANAEAFEAELRGLFVEMFDPEKPFVQTADAAKCRFCEFNSLCNR